MLARYQMRRGAAARDLPAGIRQDARKHTRHVLRPEADAVAKYLAGEMTWKQFKEQYRKILRRRFSSQRAAFDELAQLAQTADVHLGCSCPTKIVRDVRRCHTWLALEWMKAQYPDLDVRFPGVEPSKD